MSRLRGSRGHTMIELLVSMSLLAVVMGAITTFWVSFNKTERTNQDQAQSMSQARNGSERIARQLRNLASPTDSQPEAVDYADDYDIVFRTVDATGAGTLNRRNVKRVRYCLSSSSDDGGTIWAQEQTWNTSVPPANYPSIGSCPDNSWGNKAAIAQDIVNRELALPLFGYTP
ncbi:MAG TPA: prepilin-type N-terminal cleavage/methylation domain-containing protein, partial [Herpetosiphonaceae bacterium]|nr:prepilin-type N-terminal cleavage/methylation domain-containing protein [Herpetosiphonaceae bacterium]